MLRNKGALHFGAADEEGLQDLVEAEGHVDGLVVDVVAQCVLLKIGLEVVHLAAVVFGDVSGL